MIPAVGAFPPGVGRPPAQSLPSLSMATPPPASAPRTAPWTILELLKWTTARFTDRGLSSPRLDAELLVAHTLGLARIQLYAQFDRPLGPDELGQLRELVRRRQAGEPVAYISGRKEFWSLDLSVDQRVLIPRPETELAVEEALTFVPAPARPARAAAATADADADADADTTSTATPAATPVVATPPEPVFLCDVGTGSGAIALALKKERPAATVIAIDLSPDALTVARANAERLGLAVDFRQGDLLAVLDPGQPLDVLVANLPYVPRGEIAGLSPEVRHEPALALDGGTDGLDLLRRIITGAPALLATGGALILEVGAGQAPAVAELCAAAGLVDVVVRRDLAGIERVVRARKAGPGKAEQR
jgi:release factor glutamine methyltransferase